jgi:predicted nucleic acid-binding protein
MILVDTNVLLDVVTDDPRWAGWSQHQLEAASLSDRLAINSVIYAELSTRYERIEVLDAMLESANATLVEIPRQALFLAGKVFLAYRKGGGTRTGVLPDFFIGAHADVAKVPLLTRDPRRYRNYYPTAELIAP